jgi:Protein of unknown function (DUF4231)
MPETTPLDSIRDQSTWYGKKARSNRSIYVAFKIVQIVMAASIPVVSVAVAGDVQRWTSAILGALIGIIEAILQLGQYQQNWLTYRATREALRREDLLHSAKAGPYSGQPDPDGVYVQRADTIMSGESAKWLASQEQQIVKAQKA